jgi:hypothetical protein
MFAACLIAAAGCRERGVRESAPWRLFGDTAFCIYMEHATYQMATASGPSPRFVPGQGTVFRFGHSWSSGSESSQEAYTFEIEPGQTRFLIDSSRFVSAQLQREGVAEASLGKPARAPERIEGERTSDSTWVLREWLSWDYREWRRRESYRAKHPDLSQGFARVCVRLRDP